MLDTLEENRKRRSRRPTGRSYLWQSVLDRMRAIFSRWPPIEWVGNSLVKRQKERAGLGGTDPRPAAIDLQWADSSPLPRPRLPTREGRNGAPPVSDEGRSSALQMW